MDKAGEIAIVVIGRNEGQRLVDCLRSIGPGVGGLVYVDSGSTDGSPDRARGHGATVVQLDLSIPFNAARARNEGYAAARALAPALALVQFVDGDCQVAPGWLEAASAFLVEHADVAVVCGRRRERFPQASVYNRLIDEEWDTPIGEAAACGGDSMMRTAAFDAVRGFDPSLMAGEEPELCARLRRAGWRIWRIDAAMTVHDAAIHRLRQWWLRAVRSGFGYAQVWAATRHGADPLYGRELLRAGAWAGAVPLATVMLGLASPPWAAAGVVLYGLQFARLKRRRGAADPLAYAYASTMILGKFAELRGAIGFAAANMRRTPRTSIDYKAH